MKKITKKEITKEVCPFCGNSKIRILSGISDGKGTIGFAVVCGVKCGIGPVRSTKARAIASWNRRARKAKG